MPDLQPYIDRVLDLQDRVLLEEASSCLEAGARRAAYITLWLATAESLRRKFLDAATFDSQAGQIVSQIQQREAGHKAIDGLLIEKSKEYGFVSDNEATRLKHLYENRNVYGHPYEQSPGNEAVLAAAADAIEIVLERPVALRHGYLDRQATRLTSDMAFLSHDEEAVEQYADIVHGRSAPDLRLWFVRKMITKLDSVFADPSSDLLQRRAVWFLRRFLLADTAIFDGWELAEDVADHPAVLPGLLAVKELFELLSDHPKDVVVNNLEQTASTDPTYLGLLWSLQEAGALSGRHQNQLTSLLANTRLTRLSGGGLPLCAYWPRVVQGLSSHTWGTQNEAISLLRLAGAQQAAQLAPSAQEELGRNIMQAAEGSAYRAVNLLGELGSAEPTWPPDLIRGAALEPFLAVDGQIRLKPEEMLRALRALRAVGPVERDEVISLICDGLQVGTIRDPFLFSHQRPEALQAIDAAAQEDGLWRLSEIAAGIQAIEVPQDM